MTQPFAICHCLGRQTKDKSACQEHVVLTWLRKKSNVLYVLSMCLYETLLL